MTFYTIQSADLKKIIISKKDNRLISAENNLEVFPLMYKAKKLAEKHLKLHHRFVKTFEDIVQEEKYDNYNKEYCIKTNKALNEEFEGVTLEIIQHQI